MELLSKKKQKQKNKKKQKKKKKKKGFPHFVGKLSKDREIQDTQKRGVKSLKSSSGFLLRSSRVFFIGDNLENIRGSYYVPGGE